MLQLSCNLQKAFPLPSDLGKTKGPLVLTAAREDLPKKEADHALALIDPGLLGLRMLPPVTSKLGTTGRFQRFSWIPVPNQRTLP